MSLIGTPTSGNDMRDKLFLALNYVLAFGIALLCILPFVYALSVAFRPAALLYAETNFWIPREPTLEVWQAGFRRLGGSLFNSVLIASGTMLISLIITIPAAYAFGRLKFAGRLPLFYLVIIIILFPYVLLVIPIAQSWYSLGLFNTIPGLWIAFQVFVVPFAVWVLRDFFAKLPNNIEECAQIYGCTKFGAFRRVILPLAMPAIIAVAFLAFLVAWNDFMMSAMLTTGVGPRPATVDLYLTIHGGQATTPWQIIMAETMIIGTPPTVLYLLSRKSLSDAFEMT